MNWLNKLLPPKIQRTDSSQRKGIPEGLRVKCLACESVLYRTGVEANPRICPKCDHHMRISARTRLDTLLDAKGRYGLGQEIVPVGALKFRNTRKYPDRIKVAMDNTGEADAMVVMDDAVHALPVVVACFEFEFMNGSIGSVMGERFTHGAQIALEQKVLFICVSATGGAHIQENLLSLIQTAKMTSMIQRLTEARLPSISVLANPTMDDVSASLAFMGDVVVAELRVLIGFAGPRVIEQTVHKKLSKGFQCAEFLLQKGAVDMIVDRRNIRREITELLALLQEQPAGALA